MSPNYAKVHALPVLMNDDVSLKMHTYSIYFLNILQLHCKKNNKIKKQLNCDEPGFFDNPCRGKMALINKLFQQASR